MFICNDGTTLFKKEVKPVINLSILAPFRTKFNEAIETCATMGKRRVGLYIRKFIWSKILFKRQRDGLSHMIIEIVVISEVEMWHVMIKVMDKPMRFRREISW